MTSIRNQFDGHIVQIIGRLQNAGYSETTFSRDGADAGIEMCHVTKAPLKGL